MWSSYSLYVIRFVFVTLLLSCLTGSVYAQCADSCGDINASGSVTTADAWQTILWAWFGVPPSGSIDCGNVDGHDGVTVRDAHLILRCVFVCDPPEAYFDCAAGLPADTPVPTDSILVYYPNRFPAGESTYVLTLTSFAQDYLGAMTLPLDIRVNGEIPDIDVVALDPGDAWDIDTSNTAVPNVDSGSVLLGFMDLGPVRLGEVSLAALRLHLPPAAVEREIELAYTTIPPANVATAMHFDFRPPREPTLFPCLIEVPGDVNGTGTVTSSDIIQLIAHLFNAGPPPTPCDAAADTNCDTALTTADVIKLVNYMFKNGPAPCNSCLLVANGSWACP